MKTHLLIDGDIIAFMSAAAVQNILVEDGVAQNIASVPEGEAVVENTLWGLKAGLKADSFTVYLTDKDNWRHLVWPQYKAVRVDTHRPLLLDTLKQYLREKHKATTWAGLEADDVLSLLATTPKSTTEEGDPHTARAIAEGIPRPDAKLRNIEEAYGLTEKTRYIVVGRDKDFKTIPGFHHAIKQDIGPKGEMLVREISQWEADRFHLIQTLAGDRVDGFYGCPGIGMKRAAEIVDHPTRLVPTEGVKTRGVNKGEAVTKWVAEPTRDRWACIVSHYRKAGLAEADALVTARLARLLRHGEYDYQTGEVTLWTPALIQGR